MAAYWMVRVQVHDAAAYEEYRALAPAAIAAHGGRFLVRGGDCRTPEGAHWPRLVIVEFPDYATAVACYESPAYHAARARRAGAAEVELSIVDGVHDPG